MPLQFLIQWTVISYTQFNLVLVLLQPLLSEEELEQTKALAAEFGRPGGTGEKLQKLLEKRAEDKDSWVCM